MPAVNPPLIAIIGPTASGKSALALRLAKRFKGAVISADSQQLYRGARIGTNQPTGTWRTVPSKLRAALGRKKVLFINGIPHFFIAELSPTRLYSAVQFQHTANRLITKLSKAGYLPILAGGTGLYVSAVVEGYRFPANTPNLTLRLKLERLSHTALTKKLKALDPATLRGIDAKNKRRLVRALEYVFATGESFHGSQCKSPRPNTLSLGLNPPSAALRRAIAARTRSMLRRGLRAETAALKKHYPGSALLSSLGYRETVMFMRGKLTRPQLSAAINAHTWRYTRRQIRWFNRLPGVHWVGGARGATHLVSNFLHATR